VPPVMSEPEHVVRKVFFRIASQPWLDHVVTALVLINIILLALVWYPESPAWSNAKEKLNLAFSVLYVAEVVVKVRRGGQSRRRPGQT